MQGRTTISGRHSVYSVPHINLWMIITMQNSELAQIYPASSGGGTTPKLNNVIFIFLTTPSEVGIELRLIIFCCTYNDFIIKLIQQAQEFTIQMPQFVFDADDFMFGVDRSRFVWRRTGVYELCC